MACESWREKLDAYVDGELPSSDAAALSKHLRECAACSSRALELVQGKRAVAAAGKRYQPSAQLREKVRRSLGQASRREGSWVWKIVALPATLVLVLSAAVGLYVEHEKTQRQRVYSELTDLHVATLASATPVDVVSTDRHTVKPWFQGRVPFTFNLPDLSQSDYQLLGGRVVYLEQTPGAQLIFQLRKHDISVFIFPERDLPRADFASEQRLSFHLQSWSQGGLRYFVVGDVSAEDVGRLAALLRTAESS